MFSANWIPVCVMMKNDVQYVDGNAGNRKIHVLQFTSKGRYSCKATANRRCVGVDRFNACLKRRSRGLSLHDARLELKIQSQFDAY